VLSYAFKSHSTAQIMTLIINLLCVILLLAFFVMQPISATCSADSYLRFAYRLLPGYALGNCLIQLSLLKELPFLESNCGQLSVLERVMRTYPPFSLEAAGSPIIYTLAESVVHFALAVGTGVLLSYAAIKARLLPDTDVQDKPYEEDDDVVAEAARVDAGRAASNTIVLQHLRGAFRRSRSLRPHEGFYDRWCKSCALPTAPLAPLMRALSCKIIAHFYDRSG